MFRKDPQLQLSWLPLSFLVVASFLALGVSQCPPDPCGAAGDTDGDGVCDDVDNCWNDANPDQLDSDGDELGDACDLCPKDPENDADGDGLCAGEDPCPDDSSNACLESEAIDPFNWNGYSGDLIHGYGTTDAPVTADYFCNLAGYNFATDYTLGTNSPDPFTCWCIWDDMSVSSPCCSGATIEINVFDGPITCQM